MKDRNIHCVIAAILPVLLGLGLIELWVVRDLSFALVLSGLLVLAALSATVAGLAEAAATGEHARGRRRSTHGSRYSA